MWLSQKSKFIRDIVSGARFIVGVTQCTLRSMCSYHDNWGNFSKRATSFYFRCQSRKIRCFGHKAMSRSSTVYDILQLNCPNDLKSYVGCGIATDRDSQAGKVERKGFRLSSYGLLYQLRTKEGNPTETLRKLDTFCLNEPFTWRRYYIFCLSRTDSRILFPIHTMNGLLHNQCRMGNGLALKAIIFATLVWM